MIKGIILIVLVILCVYYADKRLDKFEDSRTYIYLKSKNKYRIEFVGKLKNPENGNWVEAIIYRSIKDGKVYCRERNDFMNKFVNIKEYNNE